MVSGVIRPSPAPAGGGSRREILLRDMDVPGTAEDRAGLDRLVVNLSQDCNLRCRYCYAEGGSYGGGRSLLSAERGREIVDYFLTVFGSIGSIQFFGGEPLLNLPVLDALCTHVLERCDRAGVPPPRFSIVTNGTIWTDAVCDAIRRYSLYVTVSLDGTKEVNDRNRIFRAGTGTFDRIVATIRAMKSETGQPAQVEGTFTAAHLEQQFSVVEFMELLTSELDVHLLHMPWILGSAFDGSGISPTEPHVEALVETYAAAVSRSVASLRTPDVAGAILLSFVERYLTAELGGFPEPSYVCAAGTGTLSVDVEGGIHPCFMFTGKNALRLGEAGSTPAEELLASRRTFAEGLRWPLAASPRRRMLMSCAGMNLECDGGLARVSEASALANERLAARLEEALGPLRSDPEAWDWLRTKLALFRLLAG